MGLPATSLADRREIEHALAGRKMQLRCSAIGVRKVDVIDAIDHVLVKEPEEVSAERHAEMAEVKADACADRAKRRRKLRQCPELAARR